MIKNKKAQALKKFPSTLITLLVIVLVLVFVGLWAYPLLADMFRDLGEDQLQAITEEMEKQMDAGIQDYIGETPQTSPTIQVAKDCSGKIFEKAKQYVGKDIDRNGEKTSTCARFVAVVLKDIGFSIKVGGKTDWVPTLEQRLKNADSIFVSKDNLKPGNIIIVTRQGGSGYHAFIFTHYENNNEKICGIGEPGSSGPVRKQCLPKERFSLAYSVVEC